MFTPEQQLAITSKAERILVRAGAGTGKTEVLTQRVIHLLEQDPSLSIQNIAIITFTNKATENVMNRLKQYLYKKWMIVNDAEQKDRYRYELEMLNRSQVSTIHSFCKKILDIAGPFQYNDISYSPSYAISESVLYEALTVVIDSWLDKEQKPFLLDIMPIHQFRKEILNLYIKIRSDGTPIDKIKEKTEQSILFEEQDSPKKIKREILSVLLELSKEHQNRKLNSLSIDDLLEYTFRLLKENKDIVFRVRQQFKHIFVDEFQDTSWFQSQILKIICNKEESSPSLFLVGDLKQSIYQFRGANLESYHNVEQWIRQEGEVLSLTTNFRSIKPLVNFVNNTFKNMAIKENMPDFNPEDLKPYDQSDGNTEDVVKYINTDGLEDAERVAFFIQQEVDSGERYKDFAILFRANRKMARFEEILNKFNVPTQMIGAGNFYSKKEIIEIYKVLNSIVTPNDPIKRHEAIDTEYISGSPNKITELIEDIGKVKDKYTVAQILEEIYRKTSIRNFYQNNNRMQALANIDKLKELTRAINKQESIQLVDYVEWLAQKILLDREETQADYMDSGLNAVLLITIHKAKGLEFPYVILPDLNRDLSSEKLLPSTIYSLDSGIEFSYKYYTRRDISVSSYSYEKIIGKYKSEYINEEARVLYVALTRAERKMYFIRYDQKSKNKGASRTSYQQWLGEGIGEMERKRIDYQEELDFLLQKYKNDIPRSDKWIHQKVALQSFIKVGNGILEMATGTGKTKTALDIVNHLLKEEKIESVIVTVNGNDLLEQWSKELIKYTKLQVFKHFDNYKDSSSFYFYPDQSALVVSRIALKEILLRIDQNVFEKCIIICDEVHGLGSDSNKKELTGQLKKFKYRLGLSATPEREYDEQGNDFITEEIGNVIYQFKLEDAIQKGILCEFNYYPISYSLTEEDRIKIKSLIKNHYARKRNGELVNDETLYRDISRVRKNSEGKIEPFKTFIKKNKELLKRCIIFVETKEFGILIQDLILPYTNKYHTYYGGESREHLTRFSNEDLDILITSKRISEGIDIRSVENIILFTADRALLQTIQRIGRCLRTDESNPNKRANVIDFIVDKKEDNSNKGEESDAQDKIINADEIRKNWLLELSQVKREN